MHTHLPRKRFGQHFLKDEKIITQIIEALGLQEKDRLVEIGPGLGALTHPLLDCISHLDVIEIDRDLIARMHTWKAYTEKRLTIHAGDVLDFDFSHFAHDKNRPLKLVGNLPYNISTPLLIHLFSKPHFFNLMVFMLQKEVVDRLVAKPNTKDYGRLSVFTQYFCEAVSLFDIVPEAFEPPPKVESSCVGLYPKKIIAEPVDDILYFQTIVQTAFMHRRKTLANNFKRFDKVIPWTDLGIDARLRAEALSVSDFVRLSNTLYRLK